jgi:hypothetical protein
MPEQLFLCSPLLKDIVHFTTANRPRVIGRLLPPASHLPPNHLTQQPRMKLRKKMTNSGDKTSHHFSVARSPTLIC